MDQKSGNIMIKEIEMEKVNSFIDQIIMRALLITGLQTFDPNKVCSERRLQDLVIQKILYVCFDQVDFYVSILISSNLGAFRRCTKLIDSKSSAYVCCDCASDPYSPICENSLSDSVPSKHNLVPAILTSEYFCHCRDKRVYNNSPPCRKYDILETAIIPQLNYVKRMACVNRHLFYYL
ncbi:E3 ubiquitin-protein ligase UBR1 [Thelohanellus kitauei]|uniref:E3 ubiquitin-protein ligase UBR1 n=1 Tax=Thelohanellus kitauei TaxID=669202 RepID=A0A0C2J7V5_THEKT|nr:E3 ubiquitin-protein ligase UBR1 [Thelohanellus kitauei]